MMLQQQARPQTSMQASALVACTANVIACAEAVAWPAIATDCTLRPVLLLPSVVLPLLPSIVLPLVLMH